MGNRLALVALALFALGSLAWIFGSGASKPAVLDSAPVSAEPDRGGAAPRPVAAPPRIRSAPANSEASGSVRELTPGGARSAAPEFRPELPSTSRSLEGRIQLEARPAEASEALAKVELWLHGKSAAGQAESTFLGAPDAVGKFRIEVPEGATELRLELRHPNHVAAQIAPLDLPTGERRRLGIIRLELGLPLFGQVLDSEGSSPVPGASVWALSRGGPQSNLSPTATTDAEGRFDLGRVLAGPVELFVARNASAAPRRFAYDFSRTARKSGRARPSADGEVQLILTELQPGEVRQPAVAPRTLAEAAAWLDPELAQEEPTGTAALELVLLDANGGPVSGAGFDLAGRSLITDSAGRLRAEGLNTGKVSVRPAPELLRLGLSIRNVLVRDRQTTDLGILRLRPFGRVQGQVRDAHRRPLPGAAVTGAVLDAHIGSIPLYTDAEGRFRLDFAPIGRLKFTASAPSGWSGLGLPVEVQVEVEPGRTSEAPLQLQSAP